MSISTLRKASIGYLLVPNLLFCYGWFRYPYSLLLITGYSFLLYLELRKSEKSDTIQIKELVFLLAFALIWTVFTGVGGLSEQTSDFWAHNAKFYDLYKNPWPNYFAEIDRFSCYYFGYFLVPAIISKSAHELLPSALFLWSLLGYFLAVCWVYHLLHKNKWLLFSFLWIRGIGHVTLYTLKKTLFIVSPFYMPVLRAMFEQSSWVTNQLIPVIIVSCILLDDTFNRKRTQDTFFLLTLTFVWAIFPAICLILIFSVLFIRKYFFEESFMHIFNREAIVKYWLPGMLVVPTLIFLSSSQNTPLNGLLWEYEDGLRMSIFYFIAFLIDWVLFYYLLRLTQKKAVWLPAWFIHALFCLFIFSSFFRIGLNNDWFYRGQIPFFVIIILGILSGIGPLIKDRNMPKSRFFIVALVPLVMAACIQIGFSSHLLRDNIVVKSIFPGKTDFKPVPYDRFPNVYQALKTLHGNKGDAEQYLGKKGSIYDKYLSRRTH